MSTHPTSLREQYFDYPLRNPSPKDKSDPEGSELGDVGHIDGNSQSRRVLNIRCPSGRILGSNGQRAKHYWGDCTGCKQLPPVDVHVFLGLFFLVRIVEGDMDVGCGQ